jgi:hypothetical protein
MTSSRFSYFMNEVIILRIIVDFQGGSCDTHSCSSCDLFGVGFNMNSVTQNTLLNPDNVRGFVLYKANVYVMILRQFLLNFRNIRLIMSMYHLYVVCLKLASCARRISSSCQKKNPRMRVFGRTMTYRRSIALI